MERKLSVLELSSDRENMQNVLSKSDSDTLTNQVWERWKNEGITSRYMSWLELHKLAEHFLKFCCEQERDYREFDFYVLLDSNLNYYENLAEIDNQVGAQKVSDKEYLNRFKDYVADDKIEEFSKGEKSKLEEIETTNKNLNAKINKVLKSQETQLGTEQIQKEIQQVKDLQTSMITKLENIPNLEQLVKALLKSENFKQIGTALKPITEKKPVKPQKQLSLPDWLNPKQKIKPLDALAGFFVFIMFLGISAWLAETLAFTWGFAVWLGVAWLGFIVVFRLVIGGLLD